MAISIPPWLDEIFLTACLHEEDKPEAFVVKFKEELVVPPGNKYTSLIWRVKVDFKRGDNVKVYTKSLIVKAPLTTGVIKEIFDEPEINDTEYILYNDLLPKVGEKLRYEIAPVIYRCPLKNILVLEDLNDKGYIVGNGMNQLEFPHCEKFVITLAKFHAASVFLHTKYPHKIETFGEECFFSKGKPKNKMFELFTSTNLKVFSKFIEQVEGCEQFAEIIMNVSDSIWDHLVEMFKPRNTFNVLNHGDVWTNNMLFKHDESGKVVDCKLIYFQVCRYASPVADLFYFIGSSADFEVREYKLQELYDIYLLNLNNTLQELDCPERYSREDLEMDIKATNPLALVIVASFLPIMFSEVAVNIESEFNMDALNKTLADIESSTNPFMKYFKNQTYKTILPGLLRQLERFGIFEQLNQINITKLQ